MKKLTKKEAINIIKEYIRRELMNKVWYKKIKPYVKAIVFYGSTAKELNRPDSDIDLLIFIPLVIELQYTKGEYSSMFKKREINIVLRSIERLRKLAKEQDSAFQAGVFKNAEIIFESDTEVRTLIEKIKAVKIK